MMALAFGDGADPVYKGQSLGKVLERVAFREVVPVHDLPTLELFGELGQLVSRERLHTAFARHAMFLGQIAARIFHEISIITFAGLDQDRLVAKNPWNACVRRSNSTSTPVSSA